MTASEIKYLIAVQESTEKGYTTLTTVARKVNCAKPSVVRAVERLEFAKYIVRDDNKHIRLTEKGLSQCNYFNLLRHYIENNMLSNLNLPLRYKSKEALGVLCALSEESKTKLYQYITGEGTYAVDISAAKCTAKSSESRG
ncbi:MAG: hypothetical protein NC350_03085 [Corallococcus sp.]|nr:hypothetical protein [Corallococcus sp.]